MTNAKATFDREADAIAIRFAPPGAKYQESEEIAPGLILDYDTEGHVIGVALLYVSDLLATGGTDHVAEKPAAE